MTVNGERLIVMLLCLVLAHTSEGWLKAAWHVGTIFSGSFFAVGVWVEHVEKKR